METKNDEMEFEPLERVKHEILAEDIIAKLRPALEEYALAAKMFVGEAMTRGFERNLISHSITVFRSEINSMIAMTSTSLQATGSPRATMLANELQAARDFSGIFIDTLESLIMEKPDIQRQMIIERR